jgi:nucleoside-diphosphate-sugar epimerase
MILLIGAGKLGQMVLEKFSPNEICGSKTTKEEGFVKLNISTDSLIDLDYDTYIFCIPPSAVSIDIWLKRLNEVKDKKIIFTSSTGVYGENKGVVTEDTVPLPNTENGHKLLAIESLLKKFKKSFVIRPSGLFSENSHPGKYLANKKNLKNGKDPINLIARDDVAQAIKIIYEQESPHLINLSNPKHPEKAIYYRSYCEKNELPLPSYIDESGTKRIVNSNYDVLKDYTDLP